MSVRWTSRILNLFGALFLALGAYVGWLAPLMRATLRIGSLSINATRPIAGSGVDINSYLSADITALAVIIAVVIGFNATTLQIAGQTHSLALVRAILLSLTPFLACWSVTTSVALVYYLLPPLHLAQLWQLLLWFAAVVTLMIGYLWDLPWRLSGQYVGLWALQALRRSPVARWETLDQYAALQTAVSGASVRGDLGTVRVLADLLSAFLIEPLDRPTEAAPAYNTARYRALKNLLTGCAQHSVDAPNSVAYHMGYIQAGVTLQAIALGTPMDDPEHDLYTGLLRELRPAPDRLNALWAGLRHALCRPPQGQRPYLIQYWQARPAWPTDDLRRVTYIAEALATVHTSLWRDLRAAGRPDATREATEMVADLYRNFAQHLGPAVARTKSRRADLRLPDLALRLLDKTHAELLKRWPTSDTPDTNAARLTIVNAYEERRAELLALFPPNR